MSQYTIVTNFLSKDSLISGNPLKAVKGADFTTEFTAVQTALNSKFDGVVQFAPDGTAGQPSFGFTNNAGTGVYNAAGVLSFATGSTLRLSISAAGLVTAANGLTVSGAAFTSRGITDSATATVLTLSSTGTVTIATPTSGAAFTVNGVAGSQVGIFNGIAGNTYFDYNRSAVLIGRIGSSDSMLASGASTDFGLSSPAGALVFGTGGASTIRFTISSAGGMFAAGVAGGDQGVGTVNALGLFANGLSVPISNYLSGNLTATSNAALATALTVTLPVGKYRLSSLLQFFATTSGAGGIQFAIQAGTAVVSFTNLFGAYNGVANGAVVNAVGSNAASFATISTTNTTDYLRWDVIASVSGAGTVLLKWAQNTSNANTTNLQQGSSLIATQIA